jgi:hypothetical protein
VGKLGNGFFGNCHLFYVLFFRRITEHTHGFFTVFGVINLQFCRLKQGLYNLAVNLHIFSQQNVPPLKTTGSVRTFSACLLSTPIYSLIMSAMADGNRGLDRNLSTPASFTFYEGKSFLAANGGIAGSG